MQQSKEKFTPLAYAFDDVLVRPRHSEILPAKVSVRTKITKGIELNIPILSAAMDTVTEDALAIALAREGGLGILHRNCSIERQTEMVRKVKRAESGIITKPYTLRPTQTLAEAYQLMTNFNISGIPIVEGDKLVGLVTRRDIRSFSAEGQELISAVMTPFKKLITASASITLEEAEKICSKHKIEKLPLVDGQKLKGLITLRDIENLKKFPQAAKDKKGRLLVGAAIGVGSEGIERAQGLWQAGVDLIVIDTAHADSGATAFEGAIRTLKKLKKLFPEKEIMAGNIATAEGAENLIEAGADALKVGMGPGAICTTRIIAGIGVPQITAIWEVYKISRYNIPLISDGGIKYSGDIVKAITAGADAVMIGSLFAGLEESPSETVTLGGKNYKKVRGMGSLGAMIEGSKRYPQAMRGKYVPEGIEGQVPYRGRLADFVFQLIGGLKAGMGYSGSKDLAAQKEAQLIPITQAGVLESHPHDVIITQEAPNYTGQI